MENHSPNSQWGFGQVPLRVTSPPLGPVVVRLYEPVPLPFAVTLPERVQALPLFVVSVALREQVESEQLRLKLEL